MFFACKLTNRCYTSNNTLLKNPHDFKKETTYQTPPKTAALCGQLLTLCWGHVKVTGNLGVPVGPARTCHFPPIHSPGAMNPFPSEVRSALACAVGKLPDPALPPWGSPGPHYTLKVSCSYNFLKSMTHISQSCSFALLLEF